MSTASTYLVYANLQMASEAVDLSNVLAGTETLEQALNIGNKRASTFPAALATQFASEWQVVAHQPDTSTGFSGTLFKYIGETDPARGLTKGQLVMSFRSTEFVDDAVRDSQETNKQEIAAFGW